MFRENRARAVACGDLMMVRAMNIELATLGDFETTQADELEQAIPKRPGRKPKPRCEHDIIIPRCADCYPEEQWPAP